MTPDESPTPLPPTCPNNAACAVRLVADVRKAGVQEAGAQWLGLACAAMLRQLRSVLPELAGIYDPASGKRWSGAVPIAPRVLTVLSSQGDTVRGPNNGALDCAHFREI